MRPDPALGAMWYVAFLLSITCHEAAHALAAYWGGDDTAFEEGQVSLSPAPHIRREPFGTVLVPILSYFLNGWMIGWASAPYDPRWRDHYPRRASLMALAGPIANLILAILAGLAIKAGLSMGYFAYPSPESFRITELVSGATPGISSAAAIFVSILFTLNVLLFAFNLLPLPPLDGISVIGLLLPEDTARTLHETVSNPTLSFIGIVVAWNIFDRVFPPVFGTALQLLY